MPLSELYPHQLQAMQALRDTIGRQKKRRVCLQSPTGSGKTELACHIVTGALTKGNTVAFCVPRLSLIDQSFERFVSNGVDPAQLGVVQGDHPWSRPDAPIKVCSVQTLARRERPASTVVIVDEAHISSKAITDWMAEEPDALFIGLSATPWRKGMLEEYRDLIKVASIHELIEAGRLCKFKTFAPSHPDLSGIKTVAGDYHEGQLSERMRQPKLVADVVQTWMSNGKGRPTFVFCVDTAHAAKLHAEFTQHGVRSAYVDALVEREDRRDMLDRLESGELEVICSIGTLNIGVDLPCVSCISYARPTRSEMLFVQSLGRGLRVCEGKEDLLILDHSDTSLRLGLVDSIDHDELLSGEKGTRGKDANEDQPEPKECPSCHVLIPVKSRVCPACGASLMRPSNVVTESGELVEFGTGLTARKNNREWSVEQRAAFYGELKHYGASRGHKPGWAAHKYREKFDAWPNYPEIKYASPRAPSLPTLSWIKSRTVAFAKARAHAAP
jgi:superfamily II DNA or RNA helicase